MSFIRRLGRQLPMMIFTPAFLVCIFQPFSFSGPVSISETAEPITDFRTFFSLIPVSLINKAGSYKMKG